MNKYIRWASLIPFILSWALFALAVDQGANPKAIVGLFVVAALCSFLALIVWEGDDK